MGVYDCQAGLSFFFFFYKVLVVKRAGAGNSCFLPHKRKMCEENITQFFCSKMTCWLKASGCVSSRARADVHLWLHHDAASKHLHINVQRHTSFTSMYKLETGDWTTAFSKLIKELNKGNLIRGLLHSLMSVWNNENYITNRIRLTCYQIAKILCIAKVQSKVFCLWFFYLFIVTRVGKSCLSSLKTPEEKRKNNTGINHMVCSSID